MTARPQGHVGRTLRGLERPSPGGDGPETLGVLLDQADDPDAQAVGQLFDGMRAAADRGTPDARTTAQQDPPDYGEQARRRPYVPREGTGRDFSRRRDEDIRQAVAELFTD